MNHVFYRDWLGNFGDVLNEPFFNEVTPNLLVKKKQLSFYGIGSLLNNTFGEISNAVIFGSGIGHGDPPIIDHNSVKIFGVRGPYSATSCKISLSKVIGDPGLYLPKLNFYKRSISSQSGSVCLAPHHTTCEAWRIPYTDKFTLANSYDEINKYIHLIASAKLVLAESLHAAILAAAFDVPFIPVRLNAKVNSIKWKDFYASLEMNYESHHQLEIPLRRKRRSLSLVAGKQYHRYFGSAIYKNSPFLNQNQFDSLCDSIDEAISNIKPESVNRKVVNHLQSRTTIALENLNNYLND